MTIVPFVALAVAEEDISNSKRNIKSTKTKFENMKSMNLVK